MSIYLDHNATAPLDGRVLEAMQPWLTGVHGNPASVHRYGRAAQAALETARAQVAALVNAQPAQVVFTGGGTEADNLALKGVCGGAPSGRVLVGALEHSAVLGPAVALAKRGWEVEYLPADAAGRYDARALERLLAGGDVRLVSLMLANNETGAVQPVPEAAAIVHAAGGLLHVDAVQAPGRIGCNIGTLGADLLTLSAHKIGGPKGVGAIVRRGDEIHLLEPLIRGGGQERGIRAGTENVAGIAGFGAAAAAARTQFDVEAAHMKGLRDALESGLKSVSKNVVIFAETVERLPNTTLFAVDGMKAETAVIAFDLEGVAVSSGAACSSGKVQPSHVLTAMGVPPALLRGAVRVSLGWGTTKVDVERFLGAWRKLASALSKGRQVAA